MRFARLSLLVHAGFVLTGMVTTLLGPVLPELASRWALDDRHAGYFFTAEFLGSIAGVASTGLILPRLGYLGSLAISFVIMAAGVATVGVSSWGAGLTAVATYGFGLGINIPASNLWVSKTSGSSRAAALNVLNLSWGLGAVTLPAIVAWVVRAGALRGLLLAIGIACVGLAILLMSAADDAPAHVSVATVLPAPARWGVRLSLALLFFLYVGSENAVAGWVAMYSERLRALSGSMWAATPSIFWAGLLIGRGLAVPMLRRISEAALLGGGLAVGGLGVLILVAANSAIPVLVGTGISGLGFSSVFPLLVAKISHHFGEAAPKVAGPIFALGGLGGASIPWLVGYVSHRSGDLRNGIAVPLLAVVLMNFILLLGRQRLQAARSAST